jgi:LPXTG-site transpeptidase (sortase) family protein
MQGHTWSAGDGVFDELPELHRGDIIRVYGTDCQLTFVVDRVQRHVSPDLSGPQLAEYYRVSGTPGLTLVTCGDYNAGEYDSRIVVSASLAPRQQN